MNFILTHTCCQTTEADVCIYFLCCRRLGLYFQAVVNANTLVDFVNATLISLQDLCWQIVLWHWFCNPMSLPWAPIKPEGSLEDTFWGLGLAAWFSLMHLTKACSHQPSDKQAAMQELCF